MDTQTDYIAYYRVSTPMQAHEHWEEVQARIVAEYIAAHGGRLVREFAEVGSARKGKRPLFLEAVRLCKATGATLIVPYFDRFTRNAQMAMEVKQGLKFVACDIPDLTEITFAMYANIAEYEAVKVSQRTKKALAAKKARGEKLGGYREGGFGDEATRAATVAKAAKVRTAKADEYALKMAGHIRQAQHSGLSLRQIAQVLNDKGISTARGKKWQAATVRNMIARLDALGV